jgi:hypothetical protein
MKNKIIFVLLGILMIGLIVVLIKNRNFQNTIEHEKNIQFSPDKPVSVEEYFSEIKSVYKKDDKYFVELDYVTRATCDSKDPKYKIKDEGIDMCPDGFLESAGSGNPVYENINSKIRTFEIKDSTKITLIKYINENQKQLPVSVIELYDYTHDNRGNYYKVTTYKVDIQNGELISLQALYEA